MNIEQAKGFLETLWMVYCHVKDEANVFTDEWNAEESLTMVK